VTQGIIPKKTNSRSDTRIQDREGCPLTLWGDFRVKDGLRILKGGKRNSEKGEVAIKRREEGSFSVWVWRKTP